MRTLITSVFLVAFLGASVNAAPPKHDPFDLLLKRYVVDGHVHYVDLRDHSMFDLNAYLDRLTNTDLNGLSPEEQLAYYINLYNASVIKGVCERWHDGFSPAENDNQLFKAPLVKMPGGKTISLNDLENSVIRPTFKDPRVHVALVCGARSCPPLLSRAYRPEDLNVTLDANMKRFINDASRNTIDRGQKKVTLSKIFDWYADDFGGKDKVLSYISKFVEGGSVDGYTVEFKNYDWTVNS